MRSWDIWRLDHLVSSASFSFILAWSYLFYNYAEKQQGPDFWIHYQLKEAIFRLQSIILPEYGQVNVS